MGNPSFSSALYDCATECALRRQNRRCRESFGGYACNNCRFNINRYVNADPNQADLYMLQAETRASNIRSAGGIYHIVFIISILFCLHAAWKDYTVEQERQVRISERWQVQPAQQTRSVQNISINHEIETALRRVSTDLKNNVDVNNDGKINCIDAAVQFYKYFPDKNRVKIYVNRNPDTGMHHLFNVVLVNGTWTTIEPQAFHTGKTSFNMHDVWGSKYDAKFNRDATSEYIRFVK